MSGLVVEDLVVRYGSTVAVDRVSAHIEPGQVVALLGASGSGKSSLLRAVAGLEPVSGGDISWDGSSVVDVAVHRRGFGLMFQDGQLFPHRSVAGNVAFGVRGVSRVDRAARVEDALALVGMSDYAGRSVLSLSGGQAQRVALARALAPHPSLLLLDEPLSALDRALRERLSTEIRQILKRTSSTCIYVTHDQDEAFAVADIIGVMIDGRIAAWDSPQELWANPGSQAVAEFLGFGPFFPAPDGGYFAVPPEALRVTRLADDATGATGELTLPRFVARVVEAHGSRGKIVVEVEAGEQRMRAWADASLCGIEALLGAHVAVELDVARCPIVR